MNEGIIFDSNLYRNLTYNKTISETITYFDQIISCENKNSIVSFANPFVILELLSHLSDENDPAFNNCHLAIISLFHHCKTSNNMLRIVADSESLLCKILYNKVPENHSETIEKLSKICLYIYENQEIDNLKNIKQSLAEIKSKVESSKQQFVKDTFEDLILKLNPNSTNWNPLENEQERKKANLSFVNSDSLIRLYSFMYVLKAMILSGVIDEWSELINKSNFIIEHFMAPLRFHQDIIRRIISTGCDFTKKNRKNWLYDIQLAFNIDLNHYIDNKKIYLVSDDGDIKTVSQNSGCGNYILLIDEYLKKIGIKK